MTTDAFTVRLEPRLRGLLRTDSALCVVSGVIAVVASGPVSTMLGTDHSGLVAFVGVALVLYGADLAFVSAQAATTVLATGRISAIADAVWVVGAVLLVAAGLAGMGLLVVSAPVGALGLLKTLELRG